MARSNEVMAEVPTISTRFSKPCGCIDRRHGLADIGASVDFTLVASFGYDQQANRGWADGNAKPKLATVFRPGDKAGPISRIRVINECVLHS
jgi:hypothetical protein